MDERNGREIVFAGLKKAGLSKRLLADESYMEITKKLDEKLVSKIDELNYMESFFKCKIPMSMGKNKEEGDKMKDLYDKDKKSVAKAAGEIIAVLADFAEEKAREHNLSDNIEQAGIALDYFAKKIPNEFKELVIVFCEEEMMKYGVAASIASPDAKSAPPRI